MISPVNNFTFVHVNKTAGRSIIRALSRFPLSQRLKVVFSGHLSLKELFDPQGNVDVAEITPVHNKINRWYIKDLEKRELTKKVIHLYSNEDKLEKLKGLNENDFFKFAVSRNPWDRAVSMFLHSERTGHTWAKHKHPWVKFNTGKDIEIEEIDFELFCELFYKVKKPTRWNGPCIKWMQDHKGKVNMDFIIKYENLEKDWISVCNSINIDHESLPWLGKSSNAKFDTYQEYYNSNTKKIIEDRFEEDIEYFKYTF